MTVWCCQNPLTTYSLCMSQPVIKYYSLIPLSCVQNMCRLHMFLSERMRYSKCTGLQVETSSRKILNSCSIGIHTVLHCVSDKFVRRHSDNSRIMRSQNMCSSVVEIYQSTCSVLMTLTTDLYSVHTLCKIKSILITIIKPHI